MSEVIGNNDPNSNKNYKKIEQITDIDNLEKRKTEFYQKIQQNEEICCHE